MKAFKRILVVFLCVLLLALTVGSDYFDATHMEKVEAAEVVVAGGLTAASVFNICLFVGGVLATCYVAGEVVDNKDEIARVGKNFIDSISLDDVPDGWLFDFMDAETGQEYVIGSEVIDYIQSCVWLGILNEVTGGGGENNNNNDDNDKNNGDDKDPDKKGVFDISSPASQLICGFAPLGATWFAAEASKLYQKWVNGEELTEAEAAVLEPLITGYCNQYDIAEQWNGEPFAYSMNILRSLDIYDSKGNFTSHRDYDLKLSSAFSVPVAGYSYYSTDSGNSFYHITEFLQLVNGEASSATVVVNSSTESRDGAAPNYYPTSSSFRYSFYVANNCRNFTTSYNANFPIFSSKEAAENYLRTGDLTDAQNYAHVYREADWLSDDWAGQLIDPLTHIGLTLSQLLELMKALGLNAIGNNLSPAELLDLLRRSLPVVNPELLPGESPVVVPDPTPGTDPIYYPSPDAHPLPTPAPDPGTKPNPGKDPDLGTDPDPGTNPDVDINVPDYQVDLRSIFPFCIPFDFIALLDVLDAEPVAPRFAFPVVIPALDYEETVYLDMSIFEDVAKVIRTCEKVGFIIFLMFATSKVIRW